MIGCELAFVFGDPTFLVFFTRKKLSFTREEFSNFLPAGVNRGDSQLVHTSAAILVVTILKLLGWVPYNHCPELSAAPHSSHSDSSKPPNSLQPSN